MLKALLFSLAHLANSATYLLLRKRHLAHTAN